jgi:AraC family carnitine catabolism transcriptional activator
MAERAQADGDTPEQIGFLLVPEFPLYALVPAIEALRIANQYAARRLFRVSLLSLDGRPVVASNGMTLSVEAGIGATGFIPTLFVVAGNHPTQHLARPLLGWLRRLARHGALLGGIDTGTFALAAAGLLDGHRATLHWEAAEMFRELFPEIEVVERLFVIERNRVTCAGGTGALDLMLHLIAARHGGWLAQMVADGFVHGRIRGDAEPQRTEPDGAFGRLDPRLGRVVRLMEQSLEAPIGPRELAAAAGVSVRQLERLIHDRFGETPRAFYLKLRLHAARNQLFYGDTPVQEIAQATGFSSPAVFCRAFKARFGVGPREFRRQCSRDLLQRFRPEIRQQLGLGGVEPQHRIGALGCGPPAAGFHARSCDNLPTGEAQ